MKPRVKCIHCRSRYGAKCTNNAGVQDSPSQTCEFQETGAFVANSDDERVNNTRAQPMRAACTPPAKQPLSSDCQRQGTALNTVIASTPGMDKKSGVALVYRIEALTRGSGDNVQRPLRSGVHQRGVSRRIKERCVQGPQLSSKQTLANTEAQSLPFLRADARQPSQHSRA